ncbi:hypothetical protein CA13_71780 [Planctomycetes bacterium CA13]|uniref:Type II secretion system protein n=1 Tax=Novipirellula herctigrandis TaxID=2527986 RepID=A0A5C5YNY8_9BACT|nr:hypothetical protein CA13_71780 [Planctomycetes bacterium CA13]
MIREDRQSTNRTGAFLIAALVCLLVSTTLAVAAIRSAVVAQRELRIQKQRLQTEFLLGAAIARAAHKVNTSGEYAGETWIPSELVQTWPLAEADITVKPIEDSNELEVHVTARLSTISDNRTNMQSYRTQRSYKFTLSASPTLESSEDANSK